MDKPFDLEVEEKKKKSGLGEIIQSNEVDV